MSEDYRPTEGWTQPDERGHVSYVMHGPRSQRATAPEREGFEAYFVGVHGNEWTRWWYRPVAEKVPA